MKEPINRPPYMLTEEGRLAILLLRANGLGRFVELEEAVEEVAAEISKAGGRCPQACGKTWPACCCPTEGMKNFAKIERDVALENTPRPRRQKESMLDMMKRLGAKAAS